MSTYISINNREQEYFFKTVSKNIINTVRSHHVDECTLIVNIENLKDINRLREFLDNLEISMQSK